MLVTKKAPDFKTLAVMGDNSIKEVSLSDYKGQKVVLFFYPLDFTFVCPTELLAFDKRLGELLATIYFLSSKINFKQGQLSGPFWKIQ